MTFIPLITLIVITISYGILQGRFGSAVAIAAMVSSRSIHPRLAVLLSAFGMGFGALFLGSAVAGTVASDLIVPGGIRMSGVVAALSGAMIWNLFALWRQIPVSVSQGLFGGLIGAAWATSGVGSLMAPGMTKLAVGLFVSPLVGIVMGYVIVKLVYILTASATPHANKWLQRSQVLVSFLMAMSLGSNDGQKLMGALVLGMVAGGIVPTTEMPLTVVILVACTAVIGGLVGGWSLIHTLGTKFYKIRPVHGFGAQAASALTIFSASLIGLPVSAAQVVTSSIIGAGSADRLQMVRWGVFNGILWGWVLTIPITAVIGALLSLWLKGIWP